MEVHVLNGDALAYKFFLEGEVIVARECMVEGPLRADSMEEFWKTRSAYLSERFLETYLPDYYREVKEEFEKLLLLKDVSGINLWFDHDLFCQVNIWFVIHYMVKNKVDVPLFRVMPSGDVADVWSGFGHLRKTDLQRCYAQRVKFTTKDTELGIALWKAYVEEDLRGLQNLSQSSSACFPLLEETCNAHLQRFPLNAGRPQKRLRQIIKSGHTNFNDIFCEFQKTEGVYGFGDLQVKNMLASL